MARRFPSTAVVGVYSPVRSVACPGSVRAISALAVARSEAIACVAFLGSVLPRQELLAVLERAFAHHAGADGVIDFADLKKALRLKSDYLAQRMLKLFDLNGDGYISREEFLAGVRALVFGSDRDKLCFAFRLHDHDGDGSISQQELLRMISLSLAESEIAEKLSQPPEYLTRALMSVADTNRDGRLSFDEFVRRRWCGPSSCAR